MNLGKVTVITATYNSCELLERTIKSLIDQSYKDIEYIVVDGGSDDGSLELLQRYESHIDVLVSEPDNGIADAWNKGLSLASGRVVALLNAGDIYSKDFIAKSVRSIGCDELAITYGNCYFVSNGIVKSCKEGVVNDEKNLYKGVGFVHTTCVATKSVYEKVGVFDLGINIALDTDFILRALCYGVPLKSSEAKVYMELGGVSDTHAKDAYFEYLTALIKYGYISRKKAKQLRAVYYMYSPFRNFFKSDFFRSFLRKIKHLSIFLLNVVYQLVPSFWAKNRFLSLLGFKIGARSYILKGGVFYRNSNLCVGKNSIVNRECTLDNRGAINIGNNVSVSHGVKIYTAGHEINSPYNEIKTRDVVLCDYVQVFSNAIICPGVVVGEGAVILPGSVVIKDVAPYSVVGGNPAKEVMKREEGLLYKIDYPYWHSL